MIKYVSVEELDSSFKYDFEAWFKAMTTTEPIVPKNLRLVQTDDYVIDNGKLYLSCDGMVKIKTFIHLKQTADLKDWFENCARGKSLTFGTK